MPQLDTTIAVIMLISLIFYALLGGADFGGGIWDLLARGPRADRQRMTIAHSIGPIWEANHVWLILVVVILFTGFPPAFALLMTALHIPITVMLIGIVLRGASFAFRSYDFAGDRGQERWGMVFAISSLVTPLLLGVTIGAISSGRITVEDGTYTGGFVDPWLHWFPFAVGGFAVALFAFLAAVYLTVELEDEPDLQEDFRRRGLGAAVAVGVLALLVFLLSGDGAPVVRDRLAESWWTWPLQIATGMFAVGAIVALWRRYYVLARTFAVAQVALILGGWGLSIQPYLVVDDLRLHDAAAPHFTLQLLLGGLVLGSLVLFPALYYLYRVFKGEKAFAVLRRE